LGAARSSKKHHFQVEGLHSAMEKTIAYDFSKGIRQAKKRYIMLSIILPVILIAFSFLSPIGKNLSLTEKAGIGFFSFVTFGLVFYFTASKTLRKLSELSVYIFPDRIERESNKQKEVFFWKDLINAKILEYPNSEIASITLTFERKKKIILFGFEDMGAATRQITQYTSDQSLIHRKKTKINWDNPAIMIFSSILVLVILLAVQGVGEKAYRFFNVLFFFLFGSYNLIARPISSAQGNRRKKFETIIGAVLIICSLFLLALEFFLK
jgi:hypothetical protein